MHNTKMLLQNHQMHRNNSIITPTTQTRYGCITQKTHTREREREMQCLRNTSSNWVEVCWPNEDDRISQSSATGLWIEWSSSLWGHTFWHDLSALHLPRLSMALSLSRLSRRNASLSSSLPSPFLNSDPHNNINLSFQHSNLVAKLDETWIINEIMHEIIVRSLFLTLQILRFYNSDISISIIQCVCVGIWKWQLRRLLPLSTHYTPIFPKFFSLFKIRWSDTNTLASQLGQDLWAMII